MTSSATESSNGVFRALRHRDFRLFMGGQVVSLAGTWMQGLAQSWLVYRLTHSTMALGAIGFAAHLPVLLLSPIAGLAADRYSRRKMVMWAQSGFLLQACLLAALTLTNVVTVSTVIGMAAVWGILNAFDIPGRQSLYVHLVGKEDLPNAIAINSMTFNAARVIGPSIAGFLVAALGEGWCFLVNGLTYVVVLASLWVMKSEEPAKTPDSAPWEHLKEGFHYAWHTKEVRVLLIVTALANLATTPLSVLGPIFADQIFHLGSQGLGMLTGALGVGAVIGTIALARHKTHERLGTVVLESALTLGVAMAVYAWSPWFLLSLATIAVLGFSIFRMLAAINSLIQTIIPDHYRGRIMSLYSMTVVGVLPLGNLASGAAATWMGARGTVLAGAILSLAASAVWWTELKRRAE